MLQSDRTQRKVKHMPHEQTQKSIETLCNYAYASENANELARISIAAIQVIETLLNDEDVADKVADAFDTSGLNEKADFIHSKNP